MADADRLVELMMEYLADYGDEPEALRADLRPRYAAEMARAARDIVAEDIEATLDMGLTRDPLYRVGKVDASLIARGRR